MSTEDTNNVPLIGQAPVVAPAPAAAAAPAPVTPPAAPVLATDDTQADPNWFKPRLERERLKAIKAAGFETPEEAKAAADALKAQKEAEKVTVQKLTESQALAQSLKARTSAIEALLDEQAKEAFNGLTEAQKAAVRLQAQDDAPAEDRIKAIRLVKAVATAMTPAPAPAVAPAVVPAPAPVTPPADTAPARTAPNGNPDTPPNHRAVWEELQKNNPFAAANYARLHPEAYKAS